MDIVLIAGLWLPSSVWTEVVTELETRGHRALPVSLPGVDDSSATATLSDQLHAVLEAADGCDRPLVVGHSAASTLAWMAADRRPDNVAGVAMIGGFPSASGAAYADFFAVVDGVMAFPGWEPFEGPDSADLDESTRALIERLAVPVAGGVANGLVEFTDDRRFAVPTTVICPEFSPDDARAWMADGQIPELASAANLSFVDIDSGHWPMFTRPAELAELLSAAARE